MDENGAVMNNVDVQWSTSPPTVAAVDDHGTVTAVGNGTATVTAVHGGITASAEVMVQQEIAQIRIDPPADSIPSNGGRVQLSAEAFDRLENRVKPSVVRIGRPPLKLKRNIS